MDMVSDKLHFWLYIKRTSAMVVSGYGEPEHGKIGLVTSHRWL